jgi:hypothetical protein
VQRCPVNAIALLLATIVPTPSVVADASLPLRAAPSSCVSRLAAARRAVEAWCDGRTSVERRYYDWSRARTRRQACADLLAGLRSCAARTQEVTLDGEPGPVVIADHTAADATYWQARLVTRGRGLRVTSVDFVEDCTGP